MNQLLVLTSCSCVIEYSVGQACDTNNVVTCARISNGAASSGNFCVRSSWNLCGGAGGGGAGGGTAAGGGSATCMAAGVSCGSDSECCSESCDTINETCD